MHRKHFAVKLLSAAIAAALVGGAAVGAAGAKAPPAPPPTKAVKVLFLGGTWTGSYSGAFTGTFTIHWRQRKSYLGGSIVLSNPSGKYTINGKVHGLSIKFGAVGAGATYTGSVSGTSMSGHYQSPEGGGTWSAQKSS
jgi:hypothetical protein